MEIEKLVAVIVLALIVVIALISLTDVFEQGANETENLGERENKLIECLNSNPSEDREYCLNQISSEEGGAIGN